MARQASASAPGRVNLIGEHTDYNGGFVLPAAIPQRTTVEVSRLESRKVRVSTSGLASAAVEFELGHEKKTSTWIDYVQGVTSLLRSEKFEISGFEARIDSHVPVGSGLSSSAALEVSLFRALRSLFSLNLDDLTIARLGQRVENEFVGARVGIMDQMASSLADGSSALFIDTRDLSYEKVPLPKGAELAVINSGISHSLAAGGDYNTRRSECERACRELGIGELRELSVRDLPRLERLPDVLKRRARHVITENARVLAAVQAMRSNDLVALGRLFAESHRSMRDDYEVSIPEIDRLVEIASAQEGVYGARLTGGGFGGSIVILCREGLAAKIAKAVAARYSEETGHQATVLVPQEAVSRH